MLFTQLPASPCAGVTLRAMRADDIAPWYDYLSRPEVYEHTSWNLSGPAELAHYAWQPDAFSADSMLRFAIAEAGSDRLLGTAGFHTVSSLNRSAELAYDLAPAAWGRGIASDSVRSLLDWAHGHVGLLRVQASVLVANERSRRVLERCGFEREGLLRSYRQVRGRSGDFWLYAHVQEQA